MGGPEPPFLLLLTQWQRAALSRVRLTGSYQSDDDELCGGFLQAQNAAVLQRLCNPKLTQSRSTGEALLAPDATRWS